MQDVVRHLLVEAGNIRDDRARAELAKWALQMQRAAPMRNALELARSQHGSNTPELVEETSPVSEDK
jgi:hypothetical protein